MVPSHFLVVYLVFFGMELPAQRETVMDEMRSQLMKEIQITSAFCLLSLRSIINKTTGKEIE